MASNPKKKPHTMRRRIGVMGSASGKNAEDPEALRISYEVGKYIAKAGCIMVTGACPGLPYAAARGAMDHGGFVLGVSPAFSHQEHVQEYKSPDDTFDIILYSGLGFMERDITNIRASDAVVLLGGGMGTLNEFSVAFDEGKTIGILPSTGALSRHIPDIVRFTERDMNPNIVFCDDPKELVEKLLETMQRFPVPIHVDARVKDVKFGKTRG